MALTQFILIPALIVTLGFSLLLLAVSIWRIVYGSRNSGWIVAATTAMAVGMACLISVDWIQQARILSTLSLELYSDFACLLVASGFILYTYRVLSHTGPAANLRRSVHSWAMIGIAMLMVGWSYHRIMVRTQDFSFVGLESVLPGTVDVDEQAFGLSDKGEIIPLYRLSASHEVFDEYIQTSQDKFRSFNHAGIHREGADRLSNCHGWVFTAGQYLLKGRDVDRILCDNNYFVVTIPEIDDIVIYRDDAGQILHTALVQGVLRDGTVITESKWGVDERFLHLPTDQPYSQSYQYYRTDRPNHLIKLFDAKDLESAKQFAEMIDG